MDVSDLGEHQTVKVGDLDVGDNVEIVTDKSRPVFTVIVPRAVAAEVAEEAAEEVLAEGEETEPEVIGEKRPEGESEEK